MQALVLTRSELAMALLPDGPVRAREYAATMDRLARDRVEPTFLAEAAELRAATRGLAAASIACGDGPAAIRYALRLLEHDRYDEPAHLDLVRALLAAGRHGEARRRYQCYVELMRELSVEPAAFPQPKRPVMARRQAT